MTDGLITDYSSVGVDYLLVDRSIAYTMDDDKLYQNGRCFVVETVSDCMYGHQLFEFSDLWAFLNDVFNGEDV